MHPPDTERLIVCSFEAPYSGSYTISNFGLRRVYDDDAGTDLKLFGPDKELVAAISGVSRSWNYDAKTFQIKNISKGEYIYFAIDNVDGFAYDAVEVSWTVKFNGVRTGLNDQGRQQELNVFPNPSSGKVRLNIARESLSKDSMLSINDISGRQVALLILTEPNSTIDLTHYPTGIYFLHNNGICKRIIVD